MIRETTCLSAALFALVAQIATAQQPPRPNDPSRAVTLSLTEYNRLIDLASRPPAAPALPPVASVLSSADLHIRVERDMARGVFALTGEVLRAGVSRVDLIAGATLTEGNAAGRPLPLLADGNAHAALVPGPGPFALSLDWGAPLTFAPGRASFVLPVPKSGTARATIDLPGDQADIHLSAGLVTRKAIVADRTIVDVALDPGSATEVWWTMRDSAPVAAARDVRTLADVMTLVTLGDADVRMAALIDVTVVQGDARTIEAHLPPGYELTGVSGSTLESTDMRDATIVLRIGDGAARRHQFLISLERQHRTGSFRLDTGVVTVPDAQRERGEIAVEGVGTLELDATERDGMHRLDARELNAALQSLSRLPVLAAFRYQRSATTPTGLTLDVKRFADSSVLAAVADRAVATTLVTKEGRTLTEIALTIQNRAQKFLKVTLPAGASIVSVDVAGESAKPVFGNDGTRVPLLRPGLRTAAPYSVTFVYLYAGAPFGKKGELPMTLPKMDIPVSLVEWEVFVPDTYSVRAIDGNVIERRLMPGILPAGAMGSGSGSGTGSGVGPGSGGGIAPTPPPAVAETVTVSAQSPAVDQAHDRVMRVTQAPSQNVINLQRRTAGVLPVRIDVPRAGTSHEFVKPLVVDQEAAVTFRYARR
jgi:hypothetical protein